ncbi:MAG: CTP synthetase [Alphaproteobacteria bacterium]|nr:CTP synthetase [Alphaproteobacteria bacterium]
MAARYIFITGGVVSSLGKGLSAASLASLLQARGFKVRLRKLDPYLNVDPGTMNPTQHGEVFVTEDGAETDLDLGHYERFTGVDAKKSDNITTGQIYSTLLAKERKGEYLGGTVQVIPHVTNLIKDFIRGDADKEDFVLCEIGGTVGDIEGLPFFEAIRQLGYELGRDRVLYMHVTLLPYIAAAKELKTKPTQHSVKELRSIGIQPDFILCRADREIPVNEKKKIAQFCNVKEECVISALDATSIYKVPLNLHNEGLDTQVLKHFGVKSKKEPSLSQWETVVRRFESPRGEVTIAMVGKYTSIGDTYKSLTEALDHAGIQNNVRVNVRWINARIFEKGDAAEKLGDVDAILVPGGFGEEGVKGKINAVTYARENKIPYLGICYGMQIAVIEMARNLLGVKDATSSELSGTTTKDSRGQLVGLMTEWKQAGKTEKRSVDSDLGGTMRLGAFPCRISSGTLAAKIYGTGDISERHRHRYEVNINYAEDFAKHGVIFSGLSPDGRLPEIVEIKNHPWFVGVQFHPEFKSRPFDAHPLFASFVKAAKEEAKAKEKDAA